MKQLIFTSIAVLSLATAASAQNMFAFMGVEDEGSSIITINPLNATADGYIAVYDHHAGQVGELLGAASVTEGANAETRVQVGRPIRRDVIAFLFIGDDYSDPSRAVDSVEIDVK